MTIADARENRELTGGAGAPRHRAVNLAHLLTQTARRSPDSWALVHGQSRWTWRELDRRVSTLAAGLRTLGVQPGQCVLLDGPNRPEYVQAMFAVWRVGAVLAPVNARSHDSELVPIASVCEPVAMIAHRSAASHVDAVESVVGPGLMTLWLEEIGSLPDREQDVADHGVWPGDAAWYFFTSGTSGSPKAAVLTHDQLGYVITNHIADLMPGTTGADRSLVVAPLSHGAGVHLLPQVARGAATVIPVSASLDPAEVWRLVESERITNLFTVPTILKRLTEHDSVHEHDHSSLRHVVYAGAPMPRRDQQQARATLGDVLVQYYGLAEVTGNITVLPPHQHDHEPPANIAYGTCGYPRTGMQISIRDAEGNEVAAGETGEICAAGPAVFREYLRNPEATEAALRDGWFHTGDVGMLDEQGFLYITGRLSDMYISGGSNIHPREIEEKILGHPALSEAIVLGMPDAAWGEIGVAVCVLTEGSSVTGEEIRQWLTDRMARYKVPRHVVFWDQLPRSGYGKIVRRTVRDRLIEQGWPS